MAATLRLPSTVLPQKCRLRAAAPAKHTRRSGNAQRAHAARTPAGRPFPTFLCRASASDDEPIQGDDSATQAEKELRKMAQLDDLIDAILACSGPEELTQQVAENLLSFDQRFWMRVATRADSAASEDDRQALVALAKNVMGLVDAMVKKTETQLDESATILQEVLTAAADSNGEWHVPLEEQHHAAMLASMKKNEAQLGEGFLSNAYAWIRKSEADGLDGMVVLLQTVLQMFASLKLAAEENDAVLKEVLEADTEDWYSLLKDKAEAAATTEVAFMEALQRRMESTVLGQASGSYTQRVQAEYLKELESRAKSVFQELAAQ